MSIVIIDSRRKGKGYAPLWKNLTTAGRAAEGMREDWRDQLRVVQKEIGFNYIRFHGLLHEDMMIYKKDKKGNVIYNWQYMDSLFDFLLEINIRPLLELSFMPYDLASGDGTVFWWKGNGTPPEDYNKWADLIKELVIHCINRYGMQEVLKWYFEVWNEPDLRNIFWHAGQEEYLRLYKYTVRTIKLIDSRLRVGGPATAAFSLEGKAPWVEEFLDFCKKEKLPVDFISTHPYPNTWPIDELGNQLEAYRDEDAITRDLEWINKTLREAGFENAEIHLTEWNSSPSPRDLVHDTSLMAPFIIQNNVKAIGLTDSLGFWTFTDVFEERGAGDTIFHGGFGMINTQGLKKPSFYGYWFLSRLGTELLSKGNNHIAVRKNDMIQVLMWNYCHYNEVFAAGNKNGISLKDRYSVFLQKQDEKFKILVKELQGNYKISEFTFDRENGSVYDFWIKMGSPSNPNSDELDYLNRKAGPDLKIFFEDVNGELQKEYSLRAHGIKLVEIVKMY